MSYIVKLELSPLKTKRFRAIFDNNKHADFGKKGQLTFIDHKDKHLRDEYIKKHMANKKEAKIINALKLSAVLLTMFVLWGQYDFKTNILKLNEKLLMKATSGSGLTDFRLDLRPEGRALMDRLGNERIVSLEVRRDPIELAVKTLLNVVSLGGFEKAVKKEGYDKMFHLYMVIKLENHATLLIEKNAVVELSNRIRRHENTERKKVPITQPITLRELIDNALKDMGPEQFYTYNAFTNNCQNFIANLLSSSNLLTNDINAFIRQDALSLLKHMPKYMQSLSHGLTNIAAVADKYIFGNGK